MKTFPLIAFDLDGTLADTEAVSIPSAVATMQGFGVPLTLEYWYEHLHGLTGAALIQAVKEQFGVEVSTEAYVKRRMEQVPEMFSGGVPPAPGMLQALRNLVAAGQQVCVCSNSPTDRILYTLEKLTGQHSAGMNLPAMFEGHVFSATGKDGMGVAKPAPDVYLKAASHYGVNPKHCLAVEDTVVGTQAAVAAGYTCLGYTGVCYRGETDAPALLETGARATFHHWDDFIPLLQKI